MRWEPWLPHLLLAIGGLLFMLISYLLFRHRRRGLAENKKHHIAKNCGPRIQGVILNPKLREILLKPTLLNDQKRIQPASAQNPRTPHPPHQQVSRNNSHRGTSNHRNSSGGGGGGGGGGGSTTCVTSNFNDYDYDGQCGSGAAPQRAISPAHVQKKTLPIIGFRGKHGNSSKKKRRNGAGTSGGFQDDDIVDLCGGAHHQFDYDSLF